MTGLIAKAARRAPDFVIGEPDRPLLRRWRQIPKNPLTNVYLNQILRSDDDRALHDHPWWNVSIILRGRYIEHTIAAGGVHRRVERAAGAVCFRLARAAHRLEVLEGEECWSLFITGPRFRAWGFHCETGWVPWHVFTARADKGQVGRGCGV